jgi:acetyl-CoA acetyltransferase
MHQYGTTREELAHVAVAARLWANTNPEAFARGPLSVEDVIASRLISSPIRARDCCLVTDGAAALVLTRTDRAKDGPQPLIPVLGAAAATWYNSVTQAEDITITAAAESGPRAMAMAGLTPSQIDTVQLYDAFTINTILFLEDLGFCAKGEGGQFVASGAISPGGSLPVNTNGGGLSCCHPGMYGMFAMVEAVRQMRGTAANQIAGAKTALAHGNGGTLSAQATVIFGNAETV